MAARADATDAARAAAEEAAEAEDAEAAADAQACMPPSCPGAAARFFPPGTRTFGSFARSCRSRARS